MSHTTEHTTEQTPEQIQAAKTEAERVRISRQGKPGFDIFGNPVTPKEGEFTSVAEAEAALQPQRFARTAGQPTPESVLASPLKTETTEQIQQRKTKEAQGEIDALNRLEQTKLAEQREINLGQARQTSSVSTLTGLAGSTEANVEAKKTADLGKAQITAIQNEASVAIQSVLSDIRTSAVEESRLQTQEARQSAQDILDLRVQRSTKAINNISILSQAGVTAEGLQASDPESYNQLVKTLGSEELVKAYLTLNRPVDSLLDSRVINGQYITVFQNPITGEIKQETVDLGLPAGYEKLADAGDRLLFAPENWTGDTSELITIDKGLTPKQQEADEKGTFTTTQINKGAANAGVSADVFAGYDADTKNTFINGDIKGSKKDIEDAIKEQGVSIEEINTTIDSLGLASVVTSFLKDYAKSVAGQKTVATPERTKGLITTALTDLKEQGLTRSEAKKKVEDKLGDNIPKVQEDALKDALAEIYGRSFFQRIGTPTQ